MTDRLQARTEQSARILIVDDEPFNVDYLEQELECMGYATETAANGLEALERVAQTPPDLVLLDVMMPELDGISALRILKSDPETRLIPVVLMTALNDVEDRVRGIEAGADDFLSKPVDDRELVARIKTALSLKRAIDETVGELRSTSAHLEQFGRQERDVAVLAVDWRPRDESLPPEALSFVGRRNRAAAEERIRGFGGMPSEREGTLLVAIFEGPDLRTRSSAAVQAALAVLEDDSPRVSVSAAVAVGRAKVGSARVSESDEPRWAYGADGEPVDRASDLARRATEAGVVVAGDAAAALSDRLTLAPAGDGAHRVIALTAPPAADRRIRTIVVTDIVDSTKTVERIGDRAWADLVGAHEQAIRDQVALHRGEEIDTTGDGFLASFDSAAGAIRFGLTIRDRVADLGLSIRTGIHTGEVELVEGEARGIALHVATRIAARARSAEVLISSTTRELAAGSGLKFADRGEHSLKGVAEPRRLYAASDDM